MCDPECCDGSDETDGQIHCPNICKQVGAEARKERERIRAIEKEGSKLLQGYINHGKNAKKELGAKVDKLKTEALTIKQKAETSKGMDPKLYNPRYRIDRHGFCLLRF